MIKNIEKVVLNLYLIITIFINIFVFHFLHSTFSIKELTIILILGFMALVFETLFNLYWAILTKKRLFKYKYGCILNCNSSIYNVLLWYAGILLLFTIYKIFNYTIFLKGYLIYTLSTTILLILFLLTKNIKHKPKVFPLIPLILPLIVYIIIAHSFKFLITLLVFSTIAFSVELTINIIGKIITKKYLWTYEYCPILNKATSLYNIIPFMYASAGFITIIEIAKLFF